MVNRPVKKIRSGNIEAAIWLNEKDMGDGSVVGFKTISLSRSWKKKDEDIWRNDVVHLRRNDLQKVIMVLQKAQEDLLLSEEHQEKEATEE